MLVIHPSSCCDVCLDPYSCETPQQSPHAIACGHVFCKNCLTSVNPVNCPLCRRPFDTSRIKKLHVDKSESTEEQQEIDLLKKLVMEFKSRDEDLVRVTTEVDDWLSSRDEESCTSLRKAREAVASYQRARQRERREIRRSERLRGSMEELEKAIAEQLDVKQATEESFRIQVSELEAKVLQRNTEISELRRELDRFQLTSGRVPNPLPPPPEPVSYEQLPSLYQTLLEESAANRSRGQLPHNLLGLSPISPYPLQTITNGGSSGFVPATANGETARTLPATEHNHTPSRRDKGKGKERSPRVSDFYGPPAPGVQERIQGGIIPGASPSSWVIPKSSDPFAPSAQQPPVPVEYVYRESSSTRYLDPSRDGLDPYTLSSAYIMDYVQGYGEGYRAAVGSSTPTPPDATISPIAQASRSDTVASSTNGHSTYSAPQYTHPVLSTLPTHQPQPQGPYPLMRESGDALDALRQSISEFSIASSNSTVPAASQHSSISDLSASSAYAFTSQASIHRSRAERSNGRTTAPVPSASPVAPAPTRPAYVHAATAPAPPTQAQNRSHTSADNRLPNSNRNSFASWGTVESEQQVNNNVALSHRDSGSSWGTMSRGTFSEIGLRGFGQGVSNMPAFTDSSSYSYRDPSPIPDSRTPMNQSGELPPAAPSAPASSAGSSRHGQYPPTPSMQILAAPYGTQNTQVIVDPSSHSQTPSRSRESRERREEEDGVHHSRRHRSRHRSRRTHTAPTLPLVEYDTPPAVATAPVIPSTDRMSYVFDAPATAVGYGNALGLNLSAATPELIAPTPRFSANPLLRSFSSGQA